MSEIKKRFEALKERGGKGFIPFVTAGDPDLETSRRIVLKLAELGADVIELGVPFSDPMADGPTIQRSSERALRGGIGIKNILDLVREVRLETRTPIVLFSYLNPLIRYGFERLVSDAAEAQIDGFLITDAADFEAIDYSRILRGSGLDLISLIAPTTAEERLERIAATSSGFVYAVSRAGVTGAQSTVSSEAEKLVTRARNFTDLPIAVGFGLSTREQIETVWRYADAAVVGSAIVAEIEKAAAGSEVKAVDSLVRSLLPKFANSEGRS